jgi:hypothetical protein
LVAVTGRQPLQVQQLVHRSASVRIIFDDQHRRAAATLPSRMQWPLRQPFCASVRAHAGSSATITRRRSKATSGSARCRYIEQWRADVNPIGGLSVPGIAILLLLIAFVRYC